MGYLGRRIGLSQDQGDSNPGGADGAVGGGILDLFANGYFERQGDIYNAPGQPPPPPVGMTASGGIVHDFSSGSDIYRAHIFTSTGVFNVTAPGDFDDTLEYLVVAGGGGGGGNSGSNGGGGGGAGGLRTNLTGHPKAGAAYPVPAFPTSYTVVVGAGGGINASPSAGINGSKSEFYPTPQSYPSTTFIRSVGGGAGGYGSTAGQTGGSAGGGAAPTSSIVPGNAQPDPNHPQPAGNAGGHGNSNGSRAGGGGGGAASDGGNASGSFPGGTAGYGGKAIQVLIAGPSSASPVGTPGETGQGWFAGGGGGAGADETFPDAKRGIGGRGNNRTATTPWGGGGNGAPGGPTSLPRAEMNGLHGTGGGGGGGRLAENHAGAGGSGIVVVRYKIGTIPTEKATGGSISYYDNKTIHTFTGSGTFQTTSNWDAGTNEVEYVVVAGGGAGGNNFGGGGGAGGYLAGTTTITHPSPIAIQVGAGGRGRTQTPMAYSNRASLDGLSGTPSYFGTPITAYGGGGGGAVDSNNANTGGSGGGSGGGSQGGPSGASGNKQTETNTDAPGQGNNGGDCPRAGAYGGGGGGGAGAAGGSDSDGGAGGTGAQVPATFQNPKSAPSNVSDPQPYQRGGGLGTPGPGGSFYLAGGGGGAKNSTGSGGAGGAGGGGIAGDAQNEFVCHGENAVENTGSGGGAGSHSPNPGFGGSGGSGIVQIAYPT